LHGEEKLATHQQFVDDTMLLENLTVGEAKQIKQVLNDFMEASGISINQGKSQLFFLNTPLTIQAHLKDILGYQ
jgi:hypothetical protein